MKITFLSFLLIAIFSISTYSQASIEWSKFNKTKSGTPEMFIVHNQYYLIKTKSVLFGNTQIAVEKFTSLTGNKKSNIIKLKFNKKDLDYKRTILFNDKLWIISSFKNISKRKTYLFAQELNTKSLQTKGDLIKIGEAKFKGLKDGSFDIIYSPDSTKVLVLSLDNTRNRDDASMVFSTFENDFTNEHKKTTNLPFNQDDFNIRKVKINNNEKVFVLGIVEQSGFMKYEESALLIEIKEKKSKIYKLGLKKGKYISDLDFTFLENGDITCLGLYSNKNYETAVGTVYVKLSKDGSIKSIKTTKFNLKFIEEGWTKMNKYFTKDRNTRLSNYLVSEIIPHKNEGSILIAEQFKIEEDYNNNYSGSSINRSQFNNSGNYYNFSYENLILISFDEEGNKIWEKKIPKYYSSTVNLNNTYISSQNYDNYYLSSMTPPSYGSFNYLVNREGITLIYNANIKNKDLEEGELIKKTSSFKKMALFITTVSYDGNLNTETIGKRKEDRVKIMPRQCKKINNNSILVYGYRVNKERFGILNFKTH